MLWSLPARLWLVTNVKGPWVAWVLNPSNWPSLCAKQWPQSKAINHCSVKEPSLQAPSSITSLSTCAWGRQAAQGLELADLRGGRQRSSQLRVPNFALTEGGMVHNEWKKNNKSQGVCFTCGLTAERSASSQCGPSKRFKAACQKLYQNLYLLPL